MKGEMMKIFSAGSEIKVFLNNSILVNPEIYASEPLSTVGRGGAVARGGV
jgi:hypothetical protein